MQIQKKILMVCPQYSPMVGGYERAAERLATAMAGRGNCVTILTERRNSQWSKKEIQRGVEIIRHWCLYKSGLHTVTVVLALLLFFIRHGKSYQIYHVHQHGYSAAVTSFFGSLYGIPVLLKLTNTQQHGIIETIRAQNRFLQPILIFLHRKITAFLVMSDAAEQEAREFGVSIDNVFRIGNPVDTETFVPVDADLKRQLKATHAYNDVPIVMTVGRLSEQKNPLGILQAWQKVVEIYPSAKLLMLGDGALRQNIETTIHRLGLESSVSLLGNQPDIEHWLKLADVYVLASFHEGLSNSLLEALASGLPVVSTKVSGSVDLFAMQDVGELIDAGDVDTLAAAIGRLLSDTQRRQACGDRARQLIVDNYSIDTVTETILAIYDKLLGRVVS